MMNSGQSQQREPAAGWTASWPDLSGLVCGEGGYITPRKGTLHSVCPLPSLARSRQPEKHLTITHFPSTVGRVVDLCHQPRRCGSLSPSAQTRQLHSRHHHLQSATRRDRSGASSLVVKKAPGRSAGRTPPKDASHRRRRPSAIHHPPARGSLPCLHRISPAERQNTLRHDTAGTN
ncbi:hypothetical protein BGZ61DRAFT_133553 [Ilyonectria robusta]|uniref:uncharacterized protein n=1 Tax=Ilyonectria robusta TaxID=1079257 RepID=UPI001E8CEF17|nr:uncharacterized protein BGZ61DRAFT_133553 [Ilyonectria robusta]KAH8734993.1 hypothetical protein BGZ61DRAFT_133553 [Ilyonectria robusta]